MTLDEAISLAQAIDNHDFRPDPELALLLIRNELVDRSYGWPEGEAAEALLAAHISQPPPPVENPRFKVGLYVDPVASLMATPEEEYAKFERDLIEHVFGTEPTRFIRDVMPEKVPGHNFDLYLFDFGGLASQSFGATESFIARYVTPTVKVIADNPSTYFMVWSNFTMRYMREGYFDLLGIDDWDDKHWPSNVIIYPEGYDDVNKVWPRLRSLLGIKESR
jgi:hypothetical protein